MQGDYCMKDTTDKNNELDQYGVWVKTPPHSTDTGSTTPDASSSEVDSLLPDFSFMDADSSTASDDTLPKTFETDETSLTPDELSHITGSVSTDSTTPTETAEPVASSGEEEISLDDFITGGFSEEPPAESHAAEKTTDSSISSKPDGEISLDDFMDTPSTTSVQKQDEVADEKPMDIDLSFDDSMKLEEDNSVEETPVETAPVHSSSPSTEEIDLSSFENDSPAPAKKESTNVDLDNFDSMFDKIVDEGSSPAKASSDPNSENVELSSFGIDANAEDNGSTVALSSTPKETVDYSMDVTTDDDNASTPSAVSISKASSEDEESIGIDTQPEMAAPSSADAPSSTQFSSPDDDFDVDSIMNTVKDEQGKTVCIGKTADAITKDIDTVPLEDASTESPVVPSEEIEDLNQTDTQTVVDSLD